MTTITIAAAGTPEAETADFVCTGTNDQDVINAAIQALSAVGGGTLQFGAGTYVTSRPITVAADNIVLQGSLVGETIVQAEEDWNSVVGSEGAAVTGMVSFVGVSNFGAHNLTLESGDRLMNGLIAIPDGPNGAGEVCVDGSFSSNTVRMAQGHTYSIWSVRSENITIADNVVEGGASLDLAHSWQEGIEIYGGRYVVVSGNEISGIGNAAINIGGLAELTPDSSVEHLIITGNVIDNSRVGVNLGTTWSEVNGGAHLRDIVISDNIMTNLFEGGIFARNWTGSATDPVEMSGIDITHNSISVNYVPDSLFSPAAIWFSDDTGPGETVHSGINVSDNLIQTVAVDAIPTQSVLHPQNSAIVLLQNFNNVTFSSNDMQIAKSMKGSRGIAVYSSHDFAILDNTISGAGLYGVELYEVDAFRVAGNEIDDWGRGSLSHGISISYPSGGVVEDNVLRWAGAGASDFIGVLAMGQDALSVSGNTVFAGGDVQLFGSTVENLTLVGSSVRGTGNALDNRITGNALSNVLDGGGGADVLAGLGGNDIYYVDNAGDVIYEGADEGGRDVVYATTDYRLDTEAHVEVLAALGPGVINLTGNARSNEIWGNGGANLLNGGGGADVLVGQGGNDIYYVDNAGDVIYEGADEGDRDVVYATSDYRLDAQAHVEVLAALGSGAISLTGNAFSNEIRGNGDANLLDGGGGADVLAGLGGNDTYYVDNAGDVIYEGADEGDRDIVYATTDYRLDAQAHVEVLAALGSGAISLTGNALSNEIRGNGDANVLDGGGGADVLAGLGGNDIYYVDVADDVIYEGADEGDRDVIYTTTNYRLNALTYVEVLAALGSGAISLTGNALSNEIRGNGDANLLNGGGGADVLAGLDGNDIYYVDNADDMIYEGADEGDRDIVYATADYKLDAQAHVEVLVALGSGTISLTGNALSNELRGNGDANLLNGGGGVDVLAGLGGNDVYYVDNAGDVIYEGADEGDRDIVYATTDYRLDAQTHVEVMAALGSEAISLTGNARSNEIWGNDSANVLNGGGGVDVLVGRGGNDIYYVDDAGDVIYEGAEEGDRDVIYATTGYGLNVGAHVEVLAALGSGAISLTGNALSNEIWGNGSANVLNGGGGADVLVGLGGNDIFYVDNAGDVIYEGADEGDRDVVYATSDYRLDAQAHVEVLAALGYEAIDLTGNMRSQEIWGNYGDNVLSGGGGVDVLVGLGGNDTFMFGNLASISGPSQIADFTSGSDHIGLKGTNLASGSLDPSAFVAGSSAAGLDDRIIYNSATGQILFDPDGTGSVDPIIFALVVPGLQLQAHDFLIF